MGWPVRWTDRGAGAACRGRPRSIPNNRCTRCAPISSVAAITPSRFVSKSTAFATVVVSPPVVWWPVRPSARSSTWRPRSRRRRTPPTCRRCRWTVVRARPRRLSQRRLERVVRPAHGAPRRSARRRAHRRRAQRGVDARDRRSSADDQLLHRCWLAYMSDDMPADTVRAAHPDFAGADGQASPSRPASTTPSGSTDRSAPTSGTCTTSPATASSALAAWASGTCSRTDGTHVATVAQEVLMRDARQRQD